jgi:hypothetical protein
MSGVKPHCAVLMIRRALRAGGCRAQDRRHVEACHACRTGVDVRGLWALFTPSGAAFTPPFCGHRSTTAHIRRGARDPLTWVGGST